MDFLKKSVAAVASLALAAFVVFAPLPVLAQVANPAPAASLSMDGAPVNTIPPDVICAGPAASQIQDCSLVTGMAYASGGCTTTPAFIGSPNGFKLTNGASGCSGNTMVLTMPAAVHGWHCNVSDVTSPTTTMVEESANSVTSVTVTNYTRSTGAVLTWVASDVLVGDCSAF